MIPINSVYCGDCLEVMKYIDGGAVDAIITDPPFGVTSCAWDSIIPLEPMWNQLKRIIKPDGAIVMSASQPFTTLLITSNMKMFKYDLVWDKGFPSNPSSANKMPLKYHESICVFYDKQPTYNKQKELRSEAGKKVVKRHRKNFDNHEHKQAVSKDHNRIQDRDYNKMELDYKNPTSIVKIFSLRPVSKEKKAGKHPTQKPIALIEYLIKTYTNPGEIVLDFTCGSGTTAVAAINTGRNYICIEKEMKYCRIAEERIQGQKAKINKINLEKGNDLC